MRQDPHSIVYATVRFFSERVFVGMTMTHFHYSILIADFYQIHVENGGNAFRSLPTPSFSFSAAPSKIAVDEYYAIGLIEVYCLALVAFGF